MNERHIIFEKSIEKLEFRKKTIHVFLPLDYFESVYKRYPVLYMHDGQNLIDPSPYSGYSWDIVRTLDDLQMKGIIDGIIVVGMNADDKYRILEYSHYISPKMVKPLNKRFIEGEIHSEGKEYSDFIVNELKPLIDQEYRTIPHQNGVAGSSCGGNVSLYMEVLYPNTFNVIGAFSPAYWILRKDLFERLKTLDVPKDTKIYHDMGTKEGGWSGLISLRDAHIVQKIFASKKMDETHLKMVIDKQATHTELFWQDRFRTFIEWAYKKTM